MTGSKFEAEVWAGKEPGQRLGRGLSLSLGRDRYWVEVEPDFMAGSETKPW